jgi:NitT/TauT family transport system permease protein
LYSACNLGAVEVSIRASTSPDDATPALAGRPFVDQVGAVAERRPLDERLARLPGPLRWYMVHETIILGVLSFGGFFVLWQVAAQLGKINTFFFSSPSSIVQAGIAELQKPRFWADVRFSAVELAIGFCAAAVSGIIVGLLVGWYRRLDYLIDPWLSFMYALPRIALLPLIVLWVGLSMWSVVVAIFLGVFFTVVIGTRQGTHTIDKRLLDVAESFGASRARVFWTVVLPGSVPFILASLRLGVGHALVGVFVGELYATNAGIGYMILIAGQSEQTDRLLFGVLIFTAAGVAMIEGMHLLERYFQKWRPQAAMQ